MAPIDWAIVAVCMLALTVFSLWTSRFMKSVADFLSANRLGGRYLLSLAQSMANFGAISIVMYGEQYFTAGFSFMWWRAMLAPVMVIITLSGWIYYRYRETRCLTVQQFIEVRYSKSLRIYTGIIVWLTGIVNFGIFPAVAARFFVYFCGFPNQFELLGVEIPTFAPIMLVTLGTALAYTCFGGQITIMVTDCVQGVFSLCVLLFVGIYLLYQFGWVDIVAALDMAPEDASKLNPYKTSAEKNFDVWFYVIYISRMFYQYRSWQGSQAYFSCGLSPHETKMGGVIQQWWLLPLNAMWVLLPVCMIALMSLPQYGAQAAGVNEVLGTIGDETIQTQMITPVALAHSLPAGIKGLFCAMMIFALITTQDTYLHSWGSIFVQDVLMPFRKTALDPKQHVRLLRLSIVFVAAFAFAFSLLFRQNEFISMFFAITSAIISGCGAMMIGGLYTRWGTAAGGWVTMTVGWVLSLTRLTVKQIEPHLAGIQERGWLLQLMDRSNEINSQWMLAYITIICIFSYVVVSLLTARERFNLEKMLHRGKYAIEGEHVKREEKPSLWLRITGINEEFSLTDRFLAAGIVVWHSCWVVVFIIATIYNLSYDVSNVSWAVFWKVWLFLNIGLGIPITIWFSIGGILDVRMLFARLRTMDRDDSDDGTVIAENN